MFKYSLNATKSLNHIGSIIIQIPQLPVVTLVSPPEWILFEDLKNALLYNRNTKKKQILNNPSIHIPGKP